MKKIFTLLGMALVAMSVNAQVEKWDAMTQDLTAATTEEITEGIYGGGNADGPDTSMPGTLTTSIITASTENITLTGLSTPNSDEMEEILQGRKSAWDLKGNGAIDADNPEKNRNEALDKNEDYPTFYQYIAGKGNPSFIHWEYDEETDNGTSHRIGDTYWTPEATSAPAKGAYWRFDTQADGELILGIYIGNGNRNLYIYNDTDKKLVSYNDIDVAVYYQNNGYAYEGSEDDGSAKYLNVGKMPEDYIVQHTNGITQNRPCLGYLTFNVEAEKSYYVFSPTYQLGLYGFQFTSAGETGISEITAASNDNAPAYNLAGQKVGNDYKGIVIKNGKKFVNK